MDSKQTKTSASHKYGVAVWAVFAFVVMASILSPSHSSNTITVELLHPSCEDHPENTNCGRGVPEYRDGRLMFRAPTVSNHNVVTLSGRNWTRDRLSGLGTSDNSNWTSFALSPTASAPANTDNVCPDVLNANGLQPAQATTIIRGSVTGNYTISKTFNPTGAAAVTVLCLQNSTLTTGPTMALGSIPNTSLQSGDTFITNYSVCNGC